MPIIYRRNCNHCGKYYESTAKFFCSTKCSANHIKGIRLSKEHRIKISISKLSEKNPMWKGDKVGRNALHRWVTKRKVKPKKCECCKERKPYDLANKGIYNRELKNWEWLCRRCHMSKDGRLKKLNEKHKKNNS